MTTQAPDATVGALDDAIHALEGGDIVGGLLAVRVARDKAAALAAPAQEEGPCEWCLQPRQAHVCPGLVPAQEERLDVERLARAIGRVRLFEDIKRDGFYLVAKVIAAEYRALGPKGEPSQRNHCGDPAPHEQHDDEGTAAGRTFIHTCPGSPERRLGPKGEPTP